MSKTDRHFVAQNQVIMYGFGLTGMNGPAQLSRQPAESQYYHPLSGAGIFMPAEPGLGNRISEVLGWTYFFAW